MIASSELCCNLFHLKRSIYKTYVHCALYDASHKIWLQGKYKNIIRQSLFRCEFACIQLSSIYTLFSIVTCFDFGVYPFYTYHLFGQKLLNRTQHPIAILHYGIRFSFFLLMNAYRNITLILVLLILTLSYLCLLCVQLSFQFVVIPLQNYNFTVCSLDFDTEHK